jgi:hypothetical protein
LLIVILDPKSAERLEEGYFHATEESEQFRREYEMRRIKQAGLAFLANLSSIPTTSDHETSIPTCHQNSDGMCRMKGWTSSLKV